LSSDIFLFFEVMVFNTIELILLVLQFVVIYHTFFILKYWDFNKTSDYQYTLEKKSYLISLIIYFSIIVKIIIYPYFIFTLDTLSTIIPGAMCAAGVISANEYGEILFVLKSSIVLFGFIWLAINKLDIRSKRFLYIKKRLYFYIVIFLLFIIEFFLDISFFLNLTTRDLVSCCSVIFSQDSGTLPFGISTTVLLSLFYISFTILFISNIKKYKYLSFIFSFIFLYLSYYSVIYFFAPYIYQLPTHHCPFCMMQSDYYFIGYFIFFSLFLGIFFSVVNGAMKLLKIDRYFNNSNLYSNIFLSIFTFICTSYVVVYFIKNGVFYQSNPVLSFSQ